MHDIPDRRARWDVDRQFVLPGLSELVAQGSVRHETVESSTSYYDTARRDLHALGIGLSRRGDDADWELTLPGEDTAQRFAASGPVPADLAAVLAGVTAGHPIDQIATVRTMREHYLVDDDAGGPAVEIDDDEIHASLGDRLLAWREISAIPAGKRLCKRLRAAGAQTGTSPSRLEQLLAAHLASSPTSPMARYMSVQIEQILLGDIGLRRGRDPVHDTRVAIRRLRSTLRVFRRLLTIDAAEMDADLKWFAGLLGEVRDCQVQLRRFDAALGTLPDELVLGPVKARLRNDLAGVERPARTAVADAMDSPRYQAMLGTLQQWRAEPPFDERAASGAVLKQARRAQRKAWRRLDEALDSGDGAMLHRARKAAKRARYAAELTEPVDPRRSKRIRKRHKEVQGVLGDHQDTVVASSWLRRIAAAAGTTPGENGFTFGLLYAREQALAAECRRAVARLR
jgi:CHAD domain-containing protein